MLDDRAKLLALLRDHAPADLRAIRVLMTAYDSGAHQRLGDRSEPSASGELEAETATMVARFGTRPDLARQAVETWADFHAAMRKPPGIQPLPQATMAVTAPPGAPTMAALLPLSPAASPGKSWLALVTAVALVVAAALRLIGYI